MSFSSSDLTLQRIKSKTVIRGWKIPPIIKGMLTFVPMLNAWRQQHATSGGTDSARYCYSVWLRHLVMLDYHGFRITGARVGELGPGDSIGIGLAALLSGATRYTGLDIVPFSAKTDLEPIFEELVQLYSRKEPIPDSGEFPRVRPALDSYEFPDRLINWENFAERIKSIRMELRSGVGSGQILGYKAPWTSPSEVAAASLDLIFSQAVLEHVDHLEETYKAMSVWLKPGGYASHIIDFSAHGLAPFWNGHWAYSDSQWTLVRGRREFLLNREPLSTHLSCIKKVGLETVFLKQDSSADGLNRQDLSARFRALDASDLRTRGAVLVVRKP
jgi:SAM-dependent methyltransferase